MYFDHIIDNMDAVIDEISVDGPSEDQTRTVNVWRKLQPLLPKFGAVVFMLTAFSVPVLTHGDLLSSPGGLVLLFASAGLFFACTWNEFRDI